MQNTSRETSNGVMECFCSISGGGQGGLSGPTITKFRAAFAVTMSPFHQAILRSQLCTIQGLTDEGARQLTEMVEGIKIT